MGKYHLILKDCSILSTYTWLVYIYLDKQLSYRNIDDPNIIALYSKISNSIIAKELNISSRKVVYALKELEEKGFIKVNFIENKREIIFIKSFKFIKDTKGSKITNSLYNYICKKGTSKAISLSATKFFVDYLQDMNLNLTITNKDLVRISKLSIKHVIRYLKVLKNANIISIKVIKKYHNEDKNKEGGWTNDRYISIINKGDPVFNPELIISQMEEV